ncbi:MAG TPA: NADPH-dependent 7-cyano-7-deazaguanine reductase QueF [Porticoccaceae bacterium]|nr:NADPH-dependent 7-cyano-7-deazaguanine reductase QueF [Porticoccaceae bacterium]
MADIPDLSGTPLGRITAYPERYDPGLLHPIARALGRSALDWRGVPAMRGVDLWVAYELSWLSESGVPRVAIAEIAVPCSSPCLIESKSLKLYLNSLNQTVFASAEALRVCLEQDLSACCGSAVAVRLHGLRDYVAQPPVLPPGICLDDLDLDDLPREPSPALLRALPGAAVAEVLYSDLLKTNCPVTGQPDWATLIVDYRGPPIDRAGLLGYIVSLRHHQDFHEHCVEQVFCALWQRLRPERLGVAARYTRRGGIEINPWRSSEVDAAMPCGRLARQ